MKGQGKSINVKDININQRISTFGLSFPPKHNIFYFESFSDLTCGSNNWKRVFKIYHVIQSACGCLIESLHIKLNKLSSKLIWRQFCLICLMFYLKIK